MAYEEDFARAEGGPETWKKDDDPLVLIEGMMLRAETDIAQLVETLLTHNAALQREVDSLKAQLSQIHQRIDRTEDQSERLTKALGHDYLEISELKTRLSKLEL